MQNLFDDYGPVGTPGTWIPFNVDPSEKDKMKSTLAAKKPIDPDEFPLSDLFCVRALTLDEETEIEMEGRAAKESFRMTIKAVKGFRANKAQDATAEIDTHPRIDHQKKIKRAVKALTDVSTKVNIMNAEAAASWSKALGRPVEVGPLALRGILTDEARAKIVTRAETILHFVLTASDAQKIEADGTLEDEVKN